ncbi:hypothetical protein BXZ70DRAFT_486069 [Cristinia sonorae]|uniref:F-box domain-containing protein n=1 Tax=Cristinia sonorae TaxID=1940300 RepID=A0A8K0XLU8_9AGAR|nr:hypothetical protein BXZ70DRAFT_486069 [Cristinia sonorae]
MHGGSYIAPERHGASTSVTLEGETNPTWAGLHHGFPRLPIEICEYIIDAIAISSNDFEEYHMKVTLRACALVSKAWVPRCRFHLCRIVNITSYDSLVSFARYIKSFNDLPSRVLKLRIGPPMEDFTFGSGQWNQTWVSFVPVLLPRLHNLQRLHLDCVDLDQQNVIFWRNYTLFHCDELDLDGLVCSYPPQIARLVSAIQPQKLELSPLLGQCAQEPLATRFSSCTTFKRLKSVDVTLQYWEDAVVFFRVWSMSGPHLSSIKFRLTDRIPDRADVADMCDSIGHMFRPPCQPVEDAQRPISVEVQLNSVLFHLSRALIGSSTRSVSPRDPHQPEAESPSKLVTHNTLEVQLSYNSSDIAVLVITRFINDFDTVVLIFSYNIWSNAHLWQSLDAVLSKPRATNISVELKPDQRMRPIDSSQCPKELQSIALPKCTARGILHSDCLEWGCTIHQS